jgi:hypothetical protein
MVLNRLRVLLASIVLPTGFAVVKDYTQSIRYIDLKPDEFERV